MYGPVLFLLFFLAASIPFHSSAQPAAEGDTSPYSSAELISESASIQPSRPFVLALRMLMDEGWHSYWQNPGDAGEATYIEWNLPEGFEAGDIQWSYPHRIDAGPLTSYGYSDEVVLLTEITPPADLEPGTTLDIEAVAYWLICEEICLPAEERLTLSMPVRDEEPAAGPEAGIVASTRRSTHPRSLEGWSMQAASNTGSYVLQITPPAGASIDMEGAYFFPSENATLAHAAPQPVTLDGNTYLMALQQSEYAHETAERLRGVLVTAEGKYWDAKETVSALHVDAAVVASAGMGQIAASESSVSMLWLLVLAFMGGVLLNVMPCVFPVLSIKLLSIVREPGGDRKDTLRQGVVFGAGVIVSFWALAGILLALRAGGSQIGWGFQLQSPFFVAFMVLLFFGIGLNLMGVFELGGGVMRWGGRLERATLEGTYRHSFFSGVLATIVATPCTAPFMGAALGAALVLPVLGSLSIFTVMGLGMATPYVVLTMSPGLLRRLPSPGAWMETLKQVLAFPMFATAVWLAWVFGRQTGIDGIVLLLIGVLFLGVALWIFGRWPAVQISPRARLGTRSVAALVILASIVSVYSGVEYGSAGVPASANEGGSNWQKYSRQEFDRLRSEGRPVFIDFTAAWCLTCQVNKRTSLNAESVQAAFRKKGVTLLQADWTNQDAEITRALEEHGRSGVPVYVLYTGADKEPILLPEILTQKIILDALGRVDI